jgi:hypothetical protein
MNEEERDSELLRISCPEKGHAFFWFTDQYEKRIHGLHDRE